MAKSTRRRKNNRKQSELAQSLLVLLRPQVIGLALVLISVFTMLSLVTNSRGELTGAWIDALQQLTGIGVWCVPLISGLLGVWMVVRAIEHMPDLPWQRPLGLGLIFVAYITGATLLIPPELRSGLLVERAGGWLGGQLAAGLESALALWGAWAAVALVAFGGLVLLTGRLLVDAGVEFWRLAGEGSLFLRSRSLPRPGPLFAGTRRSVRQRLQDMVAGLSSAWPRNGREAAASPLLDDPVRSQASEAASSPPAAAAPASAPEPARPIGRTVGEVQEWRLPKLGEMLDGWERLVESDDHIRQQGRMIQETLALFGVPAEFEGAYKGPAVTQYLIKPGYVERTVRGELSKTKVKVSKIAGLNNDLALALAAPNVRIEAPIPGTNYVGIEVPNKQGNVVGLRDLMQSEAFTGMAKARLKIALGEDVKGQPVVADLSRMPHLLIAGATGSGKSICINSVISCLLCTHTPETLRLLMIDPKMVELSIFNGIPHLLSPVVTEVDRASGVLFWAVKEMERRYQLLSKANARDLERYNDGAAKRGERPLPFIVVIVDEMADLMMAAPEEVEKHICRLAQMARAVGIHLIIATQRPSVNVITGLIKANFPARIAFAVTSQVDSRVILDVPGAERLLGRGDMLFMAPDSSKLERLQGTFVSDDEINRLVGYWRHQVNLANAALAQELPAVERLAPVRSGGAEPAPSPSNAPASEGSPHRADSLPQIPRPGPGPAQPPLFKQIEALKAVDGRDDLFGEAVQAVQEAGRGSVSLLQRKLRIGYSRASRLVDQLEAAGVLGPDLGGSQGREVLCARPTDEDADGGHSPAPPHGSVGPPTAGREDSAGVSPHVWM